MTDTWFSKYIKIGANIMRKDDTKRKEVPEHELNYPCVYVVDMGYRRPFRRAVAVYVIAYAASILLFTVTRFYIRFGLCTALSEDL